MSAWHEPHRAQGFAFFAAFTLYCCALAGLLGIILWRLWTEVLGGLGL